MLESKEDEVLAAAAVQAGEKATQAKIPRRSRLQRFERELDDWFAEVGAVVEKGEDGQ